MTRHVSNGAGLSDRPLERLPSHFPWLFIFTWAWEGSWRCYGKWYVKLWSLNRGWSVQWGIRVFLNVLKAVSANEFTLPGIYHQTNASTVVPWTGDLKVGKASFSRELLLNKLRIRVPSKLVGEIPWFGWTTSSSTSRFKVPKNLELRDIDC